MDEKIMDQSQLANDLSDKIEYDFNREFLVKPLEPVMVKKEFSKPVAESEKPTKDENDIEAIDYKDVETEVKEVESDFKRGVVLKVPHEYKQQLEGDKYIPMDIKVGNVIVYKYGKWFDLLKDTQLVPAYEIIAVSR
jgi:hypothetical protein